MQKNAVLALVNTQIMAFGIASDLVLFESSLYVFPMFESPGHFCKLFPSQDHLLRSGDMPEPVLGEGDRIG